MNKDFLEKQKNVALEQLKILENTGDSQREKKVSIISQYLLSILTPESFSDAQKEDLRKLALELGYKEDVDFSRWYNAQQT